MWRCLIHKDIEWNATAGFVSHPPEPAHETRTIELLVLLYVETCRVVAGGRGFWVFTVRTVSGCAPHLKLLVTSLSVSKIYPPTPTFSLTLSLSLFLSLSVCLSFPLYHVLNFLFVSLLKRNSKTQLSSYTLSLIFSCLEVCPFCSVSYSSPPPKHTFWYPHLLLPKLSHPRLVQLNLTRQQRTVNQNKIRTTKLFSSSLKICPLTQSPTWFLSCSLKSSKQTDIVDGLC